jgi:hypothetical protein
LIEQERDEVRPFMVGVSSMRISALDETAWPDYPPFSRDNSGRGLMDRQPTSDGSLDLPNKSGYYQI